MIAVRSTKIPSSVCGTKTLHQLPAFDPRVVDVAIRTFTLTNSFQVPFFNKEKKYIALQRQYLHHPEAKRSHDHQVTASQSYRQFIISLIRNYSMNPKLNRISTSFLLLNRMLNHPEPACGPYWNRLSKLVHF